MSIRQAARRAALIAPPLRRLYDFARQLSADNAEYKHALHRLRGDFDAVARQLETERAQRSELSVTNATLQAQVDKLTSERQSTELQLYVMRSDHQRAATRNESLAKLLQESTQREKDTRSRVASMIKRERNLNSRLRELTASTPVNEETAIVGILAEGRRLSDAKLERLVETFYAKLAGRMTVLSSEVAELRLTSSKSQSGTTGGGHSKYLYLDLLERALTGTLTQDESIAPWVEGFDPEVRAIGRDWPTHAQTMIGTARLRNLRVLLEQVLRENVPGDMIEAGVWRGGACILMRAVLAAYGIHDRAVWVADSFEGLPPPDNQYPVDANDQHSTVKELAVPLEQVQENFKAYGLLDDQVRFLKGWFSDTLPNAPVEKLSILRLDGDMYSSTIQTLDALYSKVSVGGFVIVDDYILEGCRKAVDDFRRDHKIDDKLEEIDGAAVFWRKLRG
ncbi:Mycinamicin III 3''-O-methyltransferase [Caballeronia arationis]|uniref:TylF/MycF family methyltransferase n=1 Tax=Caballeronia arationis TaxID=1777142 RepID=UPI00074CED5E|nr:TylF/MycF family methyltransferase [Caballeronia arationis]SAL05619.1 Mycinamicin III 3''-O-methyltransferase [Caballeronia arationis]